MIPSLSIRACQHRDVGLNHMGFQEEMRVLDPLSHLDESLYSLLSRLVLVSHPKAPIGADEHPKESIVIIRCMRPRTLPGSLPEGHRQLTQSGFCIVMRQHLWLCFDDVWKLTVQNPSNLFRRLSV